MSMHIEYSEFRSKLARTAYELNFGVLSAVRDNISVGRLFHLDKNACELIGQADDGALIRVSSANRILFKPISNKMFTGNPAWVSEEKMWETRMLVFALFKYVSDCSELFGESARLMLGKALDEDDIIGNGLEDMIFDTRNVENVLELNCDPKLFLHLLEAAIADNEELLSVCKNNLAASI